MSFPDHLQQSGILRAGVVALAVAALPLVAACTTVEGTNAFVNFETFEREVATEALRGVGIIDREEQDIDPGNRAPLVMPASTNALPPPRQSAAASLPADSSRVQIDASGLTEADLVRLRNARVVDPRTLSGRPLTEAETRQLTARMQAYRIAEGRGERPNYLPPERYFTTAASGGAELVCLAPSGELVPLSDPNCPPEIRQALSR